MSIKIYTVSEITQQIRDVLEGNFFGLWVKGEVSSLRLSSTGHLYFDLVDKNATLHCLIFKNKIPTIGLELKNGIEVVVFGSIGLYVKGGEYRLKVEYVQEAGIGKKFFDLERLKKEFKAKGYFDRKRLIPPYPQRILLLTSPTGAAVKDIINIVKRRSFGMEILILPITVQGDSAKTSIIEALKLTNTIDENIDVVVLARGGGSNEDLWIFNDPDIAKALFDVKFPTISAIGHETDTTLCDFVADKRAETPSAAAEILTSSLENLIEQIEFYRENLRLSMDRIINSKSQRLKLYSTKNIYLRLINLIDSRMIYVDKIADAINSTINEILKDYDNRIKVSRERIAGNSPFSRLSLLTQKTSHLKERLQSTITSILNRKEANLQMLGSKINYLSPLNILEKGYSISLDKNGKPIKSTKQIAVNDTIETVVKDGRIASIVREIKKGAP